VNNPTYATPFEGQVALVTGGTSGIGAAVARALRAAGAQVVVTGATAGEVTTAREAADFADLRAEVLDVRDPKAVSAFVATFQRLNMVVNCAGMIRRQAEHDPEIFDQVVDVNLSGTMRMCSAARPLLAASAGNIVNVASMLSFFGAALAPGYSASKGGVAQLTKSLAIAYCPDKIRVNAVAPGWIATQLTAPLREDAARNQAIVDRTPMKRWGTPAEVADAVVFLCSDAARFVTGVILPVDGGYLVS
jgi:NAD(P)-dependent dehydrogenase (short-subunit alcohol dehydrogenase family)